MKKVLFVCLGNICRSPLADAIFTDLLKKKGWEKDFLVDSCGTGGWHKGKLPDSRMMKVAKSKGIDMTYLRARQFELSDFYEFDLILTMDESNYNDICQQALEEEHLAKVKMFRSYDTEANHSLDVPDPYYGGDKGFENVFAMVKNICNILLINLT